MVLAACQYQIVYKYLLVRLPECFAFPLLPSSTRRVLLLASPLPKVLNQLSDAMATTPDSKISQSPLFQELQEAVANETVACTFACGGSIPIVSSLPDAVEDAHDEKLRATSCLPIDLR